MQARLAVVMGLTTAVWGPVFVLVYLAAAMPWAAAVVAAGTVYLLTVPWVLRVTESTEVAGHHTASALWFVIVGLSVFTGGIESSAPPWLVACGFLGMAVGGWRPGVLWLILSLVTYVGLALGELAGVPYGEAPESVSLWLRTTSLLGCTAFVASLVLVFQLEHDIMRRRLDEQVVQLSAADRAKSLFLANMSHELRTPMNAILGYTELVEETLDDDAHATARDDLGHVLTASRHLLALIDDLLDLSRIEVGALRLDLAEHDVGEVCRDVVAALRPVAEAAGVPLVVDLAPARCRCDRVRVAQIVTNLAHNAVKFSDDTEVRVRCAVEGSTVVVEVIDQGPGMTEEQLGRVFDEFQQADPSIRATHGGTGLGLTISRRLARAMEGELTGTAEVGKGCRFRLELPAR